jgi:1,4-alpha-glucan branching enzyme
MSVKKQFSKTKPVCKVTFTIAAKDAAEVAVVGDFNNWNKEEGALGKLKNGSFKGTFDIPTNASYEFKYLIDGIYENEEDADRYQFNGFSGTENSVIEL